MHKRFAGLITITLLIAFSFPHTAFTETIVFKWGNKVEARIVEKTDEYIKLETGGVQLIYRLEDIQSIDGKSPFLLSKEASSETSGQIPGSTKTSKDIFQAISPAVVYISTQTLNAEESLGTGFIVDTSGIVVTNYHLVHAARKIEVKLKDGSTYPVTSIVYFDPDPNRDISILKIDGQNLPVVPLGDSDYLQVGEKIYCIGNPLGLEYSFSDGMLSGIRDLEGVKWLQFTAPIAPGNSGGPIINSKGEVMGMTTFLVRAAQNLNFALAINEIKPFISTIPKMSVEEFTTHTSPLSSYFMPGTELSQEGLSGIYNITYALNPSNNIPYAGNVYIAKEGQTYRLLWEFLGSIPYEGVGVVMDNTLCVGWSNLGGGYGVVVYKVAQGSLKGKWTTPALGGLAGIEDLEGPTGLNGVYKIVNSLNPQTNQGYSGSVTINREGEVYLLNWTLTSEAYSGVGILQDDLLIVGWGVGQNVGVVGYQIQDEKLLGRWAIPGVTAMGTEHLSKITSQ